MLHMSNQLEKDLKNIIDRIMVLDNTHKITKIILDADCIKEDGTIDDEISIHIIYPIDSFIPDNIQDYLVELEEQNSHIEAYIDFDDEEVAHGHTLWERNKICKRL